MNRLYQLGKFGAGLVLVGVVSACASSSRFSTPSEQLAPVAGSNVQSTELPPLTGANPSGDPLLQGTDAGNGDTRFGFPLDGQITRDPLLNGDNYPLLTPNGGTAQLAAANPDGSFVSIEPAGLPANVQTRDLSGGLTVQKMLGTWTVIAGVNQCRLNLTQTTKPGTDRSRASAPNCTISVLASIASWKLAGTQVQFFNDSGQLIGALLQSGNRFIGTLTGGQGVSMAG